MKQEDFPDVLLLNEKDFVEIFDRLGAFSLLEPIPAAPLHNAKSIALVVSMETGDIGRAAVPPGTAMIRRDRKWYKFHPEPNGGAHGTPTNTPPEGGSTE